MLHFNLARTFSSSCPSLFYARVHVFILAVGILTLTTLSLIWPSIIFYKHIYILFSL